MFSMLLVDYNALKIKGMLMSKKILSIVILNKNLSIYEFQDGMWESMPIKGEQHYDHENDITCLNNSINELNERMNKGDNLAQYQVTIIYTQSKADWLGQALSLLTDSYQCKKIQVLRYEPIIDSIEVFDQKKVNNPNWISKYLLPIVIVENKFDELQKQEKVLNNELTSLKKSLDDNKKTLYQDYDQYTQQLKREKQQLLEQIDNLKTQTNNVQTPNLETLISYLPAIFRDFWNIVPPIELANIAGKINPPNIPSPYYSPSEQAVALQKRKFDRLDENTQKDIVAFGIQLSQHYSLRPHRIFSKLFMEV